MLLLILSFLFGEEVIVLYKGKRVNSFGIKTDWDVLKVPKGKSFEEFKKELLKRGDVLVVEKNVKLRKFSVPNDPNYNFQWYLPFIGAEGAWNLSVGSNTVYVALPDTGVDYNHPDLRQNLWKNPGEICGNGIDDDNNGYIDDCYGFNALLGKGSALDDDGHGTHLAGIIGAVGNNSVGIAGINWKVKIVPCKFLDATGQANLSDELKCLDYFLTLIRKGLKIKVINVSYGGYYQPSQIERRKFEELASYGVVIVSASGNDGISVDKNPVYPCSYNVSTNICVGATDSFDSPAFFSNYGQRVLVFAPGVKIFSTIKNNSYNYESGTSMSAPIVSGAVALLWSYQPNLSALQVKERILTTGDNLPSLVGFSYTCNRINLYKLLTNLGEPKICSDTLPLIIGQAYTGETLIKTITFRSTGNLPLTITKVTLNGSHFFIKRDGCTNKTLYPLSECQLEVAFNSNESGNFSGTLKVFSNASPITFNFFVSVKQSPQRAGGCNYSQSTLLLLLALISLRLLRNKLLKG